MRTALYALLFLTAALLAASCKKKQDEQPPAVALSAPADGAKYTVGDTIIVTGQVTSVNHLQSVNVNLLDNQLQPVSQTISPLFASNNFSFTVSLTINNIELLPGEYYVNLTASEGVNTSTVYKTIFLNALPKVRLGIYLVMASDNYSTHVSYIDSAHQAAPMMTFNGDYCSAAISSYYKQLYVCGEYTGGMNAINLTTKSIDWNIPAIGAPFPCFEAMNYTNGVCYVSYYNGNIYGYDNIKLIRFGGKATDAYYPINVFNQNSYVLVEHHQISGNGEKLVEYYSYGASFQEAPLDTKPVQLFTRDQYNLILFGNNATNGVIEIYNTQANVINSVNTCDSINDAIQLDANRYILGLANGIYEYDFSSNILTPFFPGVKASSIAYDDVNNEVLAASGNVLNVYDAAGSGLKYSVNAAENIKKVLVLYNK